MPTRTINLKMILGTKERTEELRRALWTTHEQINQAVAIIERTLLLCRGEAYWTLNRGGEEIEIPKKQVKAETLDMARYAQRRNGKPGMGSDDEVLGALRGLYEQIIPSCRLDEKGKPREGDAQASNGWVSPLMDPESQGGLSVYDKVLDPPPAWIKDKESNSGDWLKKSIQWLECADALRLQRAAGSPPGWVRKLRNENPWQDDFIKDQEKKRKETIEGNAPVITLLKGLSLIPLIMPKLKKALEPEGSGVSRWDRLAVRLAVAHLLSWESWNHTTKAAHDEAESLMNKLLEQYKEYATNFDALRDYEKERHEELKRVAFADDDNPFKIGSRMIRSWDRVRERWLRNGNTPEDRQSICKRLQKTLRGKFGDPDLLLWLAEEGHEDLWRDTDCVTPLVKLNKAERLFRKRKEYSLMTFADARLHPRWAMYESSGGTNLRSYKLIKSQNGLQASLNLITHDMNGGFREQSFTIPLAPSGQFSNLTVEGAGKEERFTYHSANQRFTGAPGGAEILFHRPYLELAERTNEQLARTPGPVWLKLTLDVETKTPPEWLDGKGNPATPPEVHHFNTALANKSKHVEKLKPVLRVLSVDLGIRTFASCSVFELVQGKPSKGLSFPAADGRDEKDPEKLWAHHERSFKLSLPGENPTKKEKINRKAATEEIRSLKRDMGRLKDILRMSVTEDAQKLDDRIRLFLGNLDDISMSSELDKETFAGFGDPAAKLLPESWREHCQSFYDRAEALVAKRFSEWRKRTRRKPNSWDDHRALRGYAGGKSIWAVEYLDAARKVIISWNLRGRTYGEVNRQDKKLFGTVASHLLHHINQLKEDRTKSGADLLIQAARGFVPVRDGVGWAEKYKPCRVILFEDLARYLFRIDRPRRENSQLMKWTHREIIHETDMQAKLYGIVTITTSAGFSSRYLASTGAPGIRCRYLEMDDFEDGLPKQYVVNELEWMLGKVKDEELDAAQKRLSGKIKPGMLVPWSGGELFVTVTRDRKKAHLIHADLKAAQNLQRRFWSRCGEALRIKCRRTNGGASDIYELAQAPGARLLGALQQLEHGDAVFSLVPDTAGRADAEYYVMEQAGAKKTKLKATKEDPSLGGAYAVDEGLENDAEAGGALEIFFRDPSGILFDKKYWIPSKKYWSIVKSRVWKSMQSAKQGDHSGETGK